MAIALRDVDPEGRGDVNGNTMNTKAGKKEVHPSFRKARASCWFGVSAVYSDKL